MPTNPQIAFLAHGRLFVRESGGSVRQLTSVFAGEYKDRLLKIKRQHEWKNTGRGAMFGGGAWAMGMGMGGDPEKIQPAFTLLGKAGTKAENKMIYSVQAGDMCGLLLRDLAAVDDDDHAETRLIHGTNRIFHYAHTDPDQDEIICSISGDEGLQNLALFKPGGGGVREITEGDSLDARPRWVPGERKVVYQSAGVGRDKDGYWVDTGPSAVECLDMVDGEIETLVSRRGSDYLAPEIGKDGSLYCIRRPHKELKGQSIGQIGKDILLIPWRLLQAIGGFLNFFTSAFTGKPLMTAGGPKREGPGSAEAVSPRKLGRCRTSSD